MSAVDVCQNVALIALGIYALAASFKFRELRKRVAAIETLEIKMARFHLSELGEPTRDALVTEMDRAARAAGKR